MRRRHTTEENRQVYKAVLGVETGAIRVEGRLKGFFQRPKKKNRPEDLD